MKGILPCMIGFIVVIAAFSSCATQIYLNTAGEPFERSAISLFGQKTDHFTEQVEIGREVISESVIEEDRFEQQIINQAEIDAATQKRAAEERAHNRWLQEAQNYRTAFDSKYHGDGGVALAGMAARQNDRQYQYYSDTRNAPAVTTAIPQAQYNQVKVGVNRIRVTRYRIQYETTTYYLESTGKLPTVETSVEEKEERNAVS